MQEADLVCASWTVTGGGIDVGNRAVNHRALVEHLVGHIPTPPDVLVLTECGCWLGDGGSLLRTFVSMLSEAFGRSSTYEPFIGSCQDWRDTPVVLVNRIAGAVVRVWDPEERDVRAGTIETRWHGNPLRIVPVHWNPRFGRTDIARQAERLASFASEPTIALGMFNRSSSWNALPTGWVERMRELGYEQTIRDLCRRTDRGYVLDTEQMDTLLAAPGNGFFDVAARLGNSEVTGHAPNALRTSCHLVSTTAGLEPVAYDRICGGGCKKLGEHCLLVSRFRRAI